MSDLSDALKKANKEAALKIMKLTAPVMLFSTNKANAADIPTQDKEEFSQEALVITDKDTSFSKTTSDNSKETEFYHISSNLSNGYIMQQYQYDIFDKDSKTSSTHYGITLLRPDGSSIDVTDMLEASRDIMPASCKTSQNKLQKIKNSKAIAKVLKACQDLPENDQEAIHEYLTQITTLENEPTNATVFSETTSKISIQNQNNKIASMQNNLDR